VPGLGRITHTAGSRGVCHSLKYFEKYSRTRFDAGLSPADAARDISLTDFESWGDPERIAVNVDTLYREFRGDASGPDVLALLGLMAEIDAAKRAR
jgi:cyclase